MGFLCRLFNGIYQGIISVPTFQLDFSGIISVPIFQWGQREMRQIKDKKQGLEGGGFPVRPLSWRRSTPEKLR